MSYVKRLGISLEEKILNELDELVSRHNFPNRSQAVRYLIKNTLIQDKIQHNQEVAGAIVIVYDHHKRDLTNNLMHLQHDYHDIILSTQHVHLNHDLCLETITLKGNSSRLQELGDKIISLKGVKHGKIVFTDI